MSKAIFFLNVVILVFLASCAKKYNSINPSRVQYASVQVRDSSVVLQYKYEVLTDAKNNKNARKEEKFKVNLVAVKITNNTNSVINTNDLEYLCGDKRVLPLSVEMTRKWLRQKGEFHLVYLLATPTRFYNKANTPLGVLIVGPGLTLLNMGIANAANKKMVHNLNKYAIQNREIAPGSSFYGLAAFPGRRGDPLYAQFKRK